MSFFDQLGDIRGYHPKFYACCPFCIERVGKEDTKYRLLINEQEEFIWCFRCHIRKTFDQVFGTEAADIRFRFTSHEDLGKALESYSPKPKPDPLPSLSPPPGYLPMEKYFEAYRYLQQRGITDEMIEREKIGLGTKELKDRIVFPDFIPNSTTWLYWVARLYKDRYGPKYKNAAVPRENQVYGLERLSSYDDIIVTEGPISRLTAGKDAVGTYGKQITQKQISRILQKRPKRLIIALDQPDALPESIKLAERIYGGYTKPYVVPLPADQDPNDLGMEEFRKLLPGIPYSRGMSLSLNFRYLA